MSTQRERPNGGGADKFRELTARWDELCARYLPLGAEGSMWRFSRAARPGEPEQGWKLHVSATVLNAHRVLERVASLLVSRDVMFKAPASLGEMHRLNAGLRDAYSQVGKVLTVYPRTSEEAVTLARRLHGLTRRLRAPSVPFDLRYRPGSNVYYRYGAFKHLEIAHPDGGSTLAVRDRDGKLVPDLRAPGRARPEWVEDPFTAGGDRESREEAGESPLKTTYRVFRALVQRGKGGVYQAIDLSVEPPRLCLLKEGRRGGELGWDGRDGRWRVRHEGRVLALLRARGLDVPRVYSSFEVAGNFYLVTEFIDGESLQAFLHRQRRRLPVRHALRYALQLATHVACIHAAGWVWRDCKPANLIVTNGGDLRPLDFEGACPANRLDPVSWATPAFAPPAGRAQAGPSQDLYALGAILYLLLTGRMPEGVGDPAPVRDLRPSTPPEVTELVAKLLDPTRSDTSDAATVVRRLRAALSHSESPPVGRQRGRAKMGGAAGV